MKYPVRLFVLAAVLLFEKSFAQTSVPDFGVFSTEEFNMKECSFDKSADAIIFFDKATSNYNDEHNLVTDRRIRFKILKEKGIERGDIHLRFYSKDKFEFLKDIDAVIASPDAAKGYVTTGLDQKTIFTRKINDYYSEVVFAMPNVKVGSIIEYRYESVMDNYGGLQDWYFQSELPTVLSSYKLYMLPNAAFNYAVRKSPFMDITIHPDNSEGTVYYEMKNIPGLRNEAYSTSYRDYLQRVNFQLSAFVHYTGGETRYANSWKDLNRDIIGDRDFWAQLNKNLSTPVTALLVKSTDPYKRMQLVYDYVRKNYQWNEVYGTYASEGLKSIADKKKGNCTDLNLLLINLLKEAQLDVSPVLASDRWHGRVDTTISFRDQFDKVIALVNIDGKNYVLDATDAYTPVNLIPAGLLNTTGFVIDKKNYGFIHFTDNSKTKSYGIELNGSLSKEGSVKGSATVNFFDYARIGKTDEYNNSKQKYIEHFSSSVDGLKIDSFSIAGADDSDRLQHNFNLEYPIVKSGSYYMLNYNLFTDFQKNPFVSDYRFTDIDFGTKYLCTLHGSFDLSNQFEVDALPKNMILRTPDNEMEVAREVKRNGNAIEVNLKIKISRAYFDAEEYDMVKGFFSQMTDMLNEPVLLKAK